MEFKDSGKRIKIILLFVILLLIPFILYMRKEHRLSRSRELYAIARNLEASFNYTRALKVLYDAYELNPDNPAILSKIGDLHIRIGEEDKGLSVLYEVLENNPSYPDTYYHLAFFYYNKGNYRKSRDYWTGFARRNKDPLFEGIAKSRIAEIDAYLKQADEDKERGE